MAIRHKFNQTNFGNGFETHTAILDITKEYLPEIMILGTFNPCIETNPADFFYGRNYFWPAVINLFFYNRIVLLNTRMTPNPINPSLQEIFKFCSKLKLTFSDLILEICHNNAPYTLIRRNVRGQQKIYVNLNGQDYDPYSDKALENLDLIGQVNWNTDNIIKYLCDNPQIKTIYFTRQPTGRWATHWNKIKNHPCMKERTITNIYTPSGRPWRRDVMTNLLHHWVHNANPNFGRLDNIWLTIHGVTLNNF